MNLESSKDISQEEGSIDLCILFAGNVVNSDKIGQSAICNLFLTLQSLQVVRCVHFQGMSIGALPFHI
jgi:hypothetical protein